MMKKMASKKSLSKSKYQDRAMPMKKSYGKSKASYGKSKASYGGYAKKEMPRKEMRRNRKAMPKKKSFSRMRKAPSYEEMKVIIPAKIEK